MKPIITRFDKNSGDILLSIPMFDKDIFHRIQQIEKCNPSWFDAEHYNIFDLIKENKELKEELVSANESITWWNNRFNAVTRDNKQLKDNWNKLKEIAKSQSGFKKRADLKGGLWFEIDDLLDKMHELEQGSDINDSN